MLDLDLARAANTKAATGGVYAERFWSHVAKSEGDGCWTWTASRDRLGYGRMKVGSHTDGSRKTVSAHRLAWELAEGPIPEGLCVLHRCDNRPCVRPEHLFLGTVADNNHDMIAKGRQARGDRSGARTKPERLARGERNSKSKMTEPDVRLARALYRSGLSSMKDLARLYGIWPNAMWRILRGESWAHVTNEAYP